MFPALYAPAVARARFWMAVRPPGGRLRCVELARDCLQGVFAAAAEVASFSARLASAGIETFRQQLAGLVAPLAGLRERNLRVDAQGRRLALAGQPIVEPPALARHLNQQLHAPAVSVLVAGRLAGVLHLPDKGVSKCHRCSADGCRSSSGYRQKCRQDDGI